MSVPAPTIEAVDALLAAWEARLRRMDENLIALEGDDTYQALAGVAGKRAALLGVTKERVLPALDAVTDLFQQRAQLAEVVGRARAARASISALTFWDRDEKLALVVRLLRAPSIDLGVRALPLAERSLLDEPEQEIRREPEVVLAEMVRTFERARDVLLAAAQARRDLDLALAAIQREIQALRALSRGLGGAAAAEIDAADRALAALAERAQQDPLGCAASPAAPAIPELAAIRSRLEGEGLAVARVTAALDQARAILRSLGEIHPRAEAALLAASSAIAVEDAADHLGATLDEAQLAGLDGWLAKLAATAEARRFTSAEVGLARFHATAAGYLASEQSAIARAEAAIGARDELRGRLAARRAQAAALATRAGVDPAPLDEKARAADRLLRAEPLPLTRARRIVEDYEAAVLALHRR